MKLAVVGEILMHQDPFREANLRGAGKAVLDATVSTCYISRVRSFAQNRNPSENLKSAISDIFCFPGGPHHLPRAPARSRPARGASAGAERRAGGAARGHGQDDSGRVEP